MKLVTKARLIGCGSGAIVFIAGIFLLLQWSSASVLLRVAIGIPFAYLSFLIGCLIGEHWLRSQNDDNNNEWS